MADTPKKKRTRRTKKETLIVREESKRLYIDGHSYREIASIVKCSLSSVCRWADEDDWKANRERWRAEARRSAEYRVRERLGYERAPVLEKIYDDSRMVAGRMAAYLLNGGEYCPHCGRGEDSGHPLQRANESDSEFAERKHLAAKNPTFRFKSDDWVKLNRFMLEILGVGMAGDDAKEEDPDDLDDFLVEDLALHLARVEGGADSLGAEVSDLRRRVTDLELFVERAREQFGDEPVLRLLEVA